MMAAHRPGSRSRPRNQTLTILAVLAALAAAGPDASADFSFQTLHTFNYTGGTEGANPVAGVIADAQGNLYGTTEFGGTSNYGTVFKLSAGANPTLSTIATFNDSNGGHPEGGLVADAQGNLYGTTNNGGADFSGTIFKLTTGATPTLSTVVTFTGGNGQLPQDGLIADAQGNLYGTTQTTVFELKTGATPTLITLASVSGSKAGLVFDSQGNLYGTTYNGGANGEGSVFKLTTGATPTLTTLLSFSGANGANPYSTLTVDAQGNLYGTTYGGGAHGDGTVFKLTTGATPTLTTLFSFSGANGSNPYAGVIADAQGNLYGTTGGGGTNNDGTVFELTTGATPMLTTLVSFTGTNGLGPSASLSTDAQGDLFGTTSGNGFSNYGNVFELSPIVSVPEPASYLVMAQGCVVMVGVLIRSRLRRRRA